MIAPKKEKKTAYSTVDRILGTAILITFATILLEIMVLQTGQILRIIFTFVIPLLLFIKGIHAVVNRKTSVYLIYIGTFGVSKEKYARIIGVFFIIAAVFIFVFFYNMFY